MIEMVEVLKLFSKKFEEFHITKRYDYKLIKVSSVRDYWDNPVVKVRVEMFDAVFVANTFIKGNSNNEMVAEDLYNNITKAIFKFPNKHKFPEKRK